MAAPKGNKFWLARATSGRDRIFSTPAELEVACIEYFDWCHDNPLEEAIVYQGELGKEAKPLMRAMTIDGLCTFLGATVRTWHNYRTGEEYKDFFLVTESVEQIIRDQKFSGAAAGLLNANIIARDLGLKDSTDVNNTGVIGVASVPIEEYKKARADMIEKDDC